jgi:hypothetical protein
VTRDVSAPLLCEVSDEPGSTGDDRAPFVAVKAIAIVTHQGPEKVKDPVGRHLGACRYSTISRAMPRTSISNSRPTTGGRAKCQVSPPGTAPRRTSSSGRIGKTSCTE